MRVPPSSHTPPPPRRRRPAPPLVLAPITIRPPRPTRPAHGPVAAAVALDRQVTRWHTDHADHRAPVDALRPVLVDFCRAMHVAGVHGPSVRRLVASVLLGALGDDGAADERARVVREVGSTVDVIYLMGEHRA